MLVEYPGYFLESNDRTNPNIFLQNSSNVYDWIVSAFVCGWSLGTSSDIYLSSHRNPKALFLITTLTSIKNVCSDMFKHFVFYIVKIILYNFFWYYKNSTKIILIFFFTQLELLLFLNQL